MVRLLPDTEFILRSYRLMMAAVFKDRPLILVVEGPQYEWIRKPLSWSRDRERIRWSS